MAVQKFDHETTGEMMREIVGNAIRAQVPPGCAPAGPGAISAWVAGVPAPQGSKKAITRRGGFGRPVLVESSTKVRPWRQDVRAAFAGDRDEPGGFAIPLAFGKDQPVVVKIVFVMPRTKAMRNRPSADFPMVQKPDVDKLQRAVLDALTSAGVYRDDSQVVACYGFKRRAEPGEATGAMIHVEPYREADALPTGVVTGSTLRRDPDGQITVTTAVEGTSVAQAAEGFERFSRMLNESVADTRVVHQLSCPARVRFLPCTCGTETP